MCEAGAITPKRVRARVIENLYVHMMSISVKGFNLKDEAFFRRVASKLSFIRGGPQTQILASPPFAP